MNIIMDIKAPLSNSGKCPLCDVNFSGGFKSKKIICPGCKKQIYLEDAIIYNLLSNTYILEFLNYLPIFGKSYHNVNTEKAIVGIKKKIKLKKSFSNIKNIFVSVLKKPEDKSFDKINPVATNIKKISFDVITSGRKADLNREIDISYSINYLDNRYKFPLWCEYLQLGSELMEDHDYKTAIIMWASMLDAFYDEVLSKKIKGYSIFVKDIDLPTKNKLIEELLLISLNGYKNKLEKLFSLRNKIVHGNRNRVICSRGDCEEGLLLTLKVMYLCRLSKTTGHPKPNILQKNKFEKHSKHKLKRDVK